jgi:hypothetical protein
MDCPRLGSALIGFSLILLALQVSAAPPPNAVHIRGTVKSVSSGVLTLSTSAGVVTVREAPPVRVTELVPARRALISGGRFVGITSVTAKDGSQRAVEVHVFPESMRGAGEGSRPWDYPGTRLHGSRMTNGTVAPSGVTSSRMTNGTISAKSAGSAIVVTYKSGASSGSQTITIPPGIPVVTFRPGAATDLKPGASVFVMATRNADGTLTASRIMVGANGAKPPM